MFIHIYTELFENNIYSCSGLAAAGDKSATDKSATRPPLPPPGCGGEWEKTGGNWWVGIRAV